MFLNPTLKRIIECSFDPGSVFHMQGGKFVILLFFPTKKPLPGKVKVFFEKLTFARTKANVLVFLT